MAWAQPLVRGLRFCKSHGQATKNSPKTEKNKNIKYLF